MSLVSIRSTFQQPRLWTVVVAIFTMCLLAWCLSLVNLTDGVAIVACLALACAALLLLGLRQYPAMAALCIGVAIFLDWYPALPYPFGGPGIPFAPILAVVLCGYVISATRSTLVAVSKRIWLWLALFVLSAPAILAGLSPQSSINYYGTLFVAPLVFFTLGTIVVQNEGQFRKLLQWLAGLATLVAVHTLIQAITGIFLFETPFVHQFLETYSDFTFTGTDVSRAGSFLLNPDTNGAFLAISTFIPLGLFVGSSSRFARLLYGAEVGLLLLALLSTYAVGPILAMCAGMLCYLVLTMRGSRGFQVAAIIGVVALGVYIALPTQFNVLLNHAQQPRTLTLRLSIWRTTLNMIAQYPVSGIGLGSANYVALEDFFRVPEQNVFEPQAHNAYLEVTVYAGIVVGIIYTWLIVGALKDAITSVINSARRYRSILAVVPAACVALTFYSFGGAGWTCRPLAWLVWLLVGAAVSPVLLDSLSKLQHGDYRPVMSRTARSADNDSTPLLWRQRAQQHQRSYTATVQPSQPRSASGGMRLASPGFGAITIELPVLANDTPSDDEASADDDVIPADLGVDMMQAITSPSVTVPDAEPWRVATAEQASVAMSQSRRRAGHSTPLMKLLKDTGVYALAAMISPLVSLVLAPILTRHLTQREYGTVVLLNTGVALLQYLTQLGLGPALVRAYNYEHSTPQDRRIVIGSVFMLISLVSIPLILLLVLFSPLVATTFLNAPSFGDLVALAAIGILAQNLSVPGLAWLLAESKKLAYTSLTLINLGVVVCANLLLVIVLHMGSRGAILASMLGNVVVALVLIPVIILRSSFRVRRDILKSLLVVGLPYIPGYAAVWVLQLADRYLLGVLGSVQQVASYSIGYTLGWALTSVVISPFVSSWGAQMYAIAKREDARDVFRLVFRFYTLVLLFAGFGLSTIGPFILAALFPASYQSAAPVIIFVAAASVLYGPYYIFMIGAHLHKKLWLFPIYMGTSALVNVLLNLMLIPSLGAVGAALATLLGYGTLAFLAYLGNQVIYPVRFEIGRLLAAALVGVVLYGGAARLAMGMPAVWAWAERLAALVCYAPILLGFALDYRRGSQAVRGRQILQYLSQSRYTSLAFDYARRLPFAALAVGKVAGK